MAKKKTSSALMASPSAVWRAMGEDLVVVDEAKGKVAVLNATAKMILDGILEGATDASIAARLTKAFIFEKKADLRAEIHNTRNSLVRAGVLVKTRPFVPAQVSIKDVSTALQDMDLTKSTVSQYE